MEITTKIDYQTAIMESMKLLEGPMTDQNVRCVVMPVKDNTRFNLFMFGDIDGEDVLAKPIIVSLKDGRIKIEKNNTDLDLRAELLKRGVVEEDIL